MKLYATTCFGLIFIMFCEEPKQNTVSDFCEQVRSEVYDLRKLSEREISALTRPRKEAILSLRSKFRELCEKSNIQRTGPNRLSRKTKTGRS